MTNEIDAIRTILRKAYQVEVDGYTFYSMVADRSDKPAVQQVFARLAADEAQHKAYLKNIMRGYEDAGAGSFRIDPRAPDLDELSSQVFTDAFRRQAQGAESELGALSTGVLLELNAHDVFSQLARDEKDPAIRGFFTFLSDWEEQHLRLLERLYEEVRQDFQLEG